MTLFAKEIFDEYAKIPGSKPESLDSSMIKSSSKKNDYNLKELPRYKFLLPIFALMVKFQYFIGFPVAPHLPPWAEKIRYCYKVRQHRR